MKGSAMKKLCSALIVMMFAICFNAMAEDTDSSGSAVSADASTSVDTASEVTPATDDTAK
jgi:hypothetical protein